MLGGDLFFSPFSHISLTENISAKFLPSSSCSAISFLMEKMPLKWVMGHQLSFVMALMFVLLDLTNEVSSGTVSQASELMEKLLTLCNSPLPEEKTVCIP